MFCRPDPNFLKFSKSGPEELFCFSDQDVSAHGFEYELGAAAVNGTEVILVEGNPEPSFISFRCCLKMR